MYVLYIYIYPIYNSHVDKKKVDVLGEEEDAVPARAGRRKGEVPLVVLRDDERGSGREEDAVVGRVSRAPFSRPWPVGV
jgi:hypothetical protein